MVSGETRDITYYYHVFYPSAMKALSVNDCHRFAKEELNVKYWRVRYLR